MPARRAPSGRPPAPPREPDSQAVVGGAGCGVLFFRLSRASGEGLTEALAGLGMRRSEFAVLHLLGDAEALSQQAVARALRIHPSNLVALIDELEEGGLVARRRDPGDRRRYLVELTRRGRGRLIEAEQAVVGAEQEMLSPLSRAERVRLRELLTRLAGHSCAPEGRCGG